MPTVLRFRAMRFIIYVNDHEPPHVHVELPDGEVVAILEEATNTARFRNIHGRVGPRDLTAIGAIIMEHFETLTAEWKRYHP